MCLQPSKRRRHGVGSFDPDSDEELDVDISATVDATTRSIITESRLYVSKRVKANPSYPTATLAPILEEPEVIKISETIEEKQTAIKIEIKRKQVRLSTSYLYQNVHPNFPGCVSNDAKVFQTLRRASDEHFT